jgi:transposase-like protein
LTASLMPHNVQTATPASAFSTEFGTSPMTTRRRFTGDFKARVAIEALRGDKTIQEIASKHKVHPNQVSVWKQQAIAGLSEVFSNGTDRERQNHESEVRDLHAKIGQLTVERDFLSNGLKR